MAPPSKKHGFGKFPPISDLRFSDFAQKCDFSPLRMAQRGENPHFEPPTRDGGSDIGGNFLKNWPMGGYPCFGHFLEILGISDENGVQSWPPRESTPAEKTGHPSRGVHRPSGPTMGVILTPL